MLLIFTVLAIFGMAYGQRSYYSCHDCPCYEYRIHCKGFGGMKTTWQKANDYCKSLGADALGLATIDSARSFKGIRDLIRAKPNSYDKKSCHNWGFWIGLKDRRPVKVPRHKTHPEFFDWEEPDQCNIYSNWSPTNPNDNQTKDKEGQNCVQMWFRRKMNGRYDDEYCSKKKGFICQFKIPCASCPTPSPPPPGPGR